MTTVVGALQAALAVSHEMVYGYGLAAAHLSGKPYAAALAALADTQARRDRLAGLLRERGQVPAAAAPAYAPPSPVATAAAATALCVLLEHAAEGAAWDLVAASASGDELRALGVRWLGVAAARAAQWAGKAAAAREPALPGQPPT
ncbi:MAG: hypothetical protein QOD07_1334 [Frankiaceae bacterium]|jgi:hypothetical protein|nr:hypothetical protein [Frankiaceae bacterium]